MIPGSFSIDTRGRHLFAVWTRSHRMFCCKIESVPPLKAMAIPQHNRRHVITASEIGEFVYCPKAWQLKCEGAEADSPALAEGTSFHIEHGANVAQSARLWRTARMLLLMALALLVGMSLFWLATEGMK